MVGQRPLVAKELLGRGGLHVLNWTYYKNGSVNVGSDGVWIDEITTVGGTLP